MTIVHLGAKRLQGIKVDRVVDSLGSDADGTNSGVTLDTSNKKLGTGAYSLSGANPVHFPDANNNKLLPSTGDFSITCWIYHTGHSDHQQIFRCQDSNGSSEGEFRINSSGTASQDDKLALTLNDGTNGTGGSSATVMSTNSVTQNAWVHLAVTRTGATVKLYINGTLETNQNTSGTFSTSSKWGITTPRIGRMENANETIQGKIDDLGVWHRVLTATEIGKLANNNSNENYLSATASGSKQLDESANKYGILLASNNPLIGTTLKSITFSMKKNSSPTGNVQAKIYKSDSTTATATSSTTLDASTLTTSFVDKTFEFASGVTLESGDRIVFEGGSHDGTNQIVFEYNSTSFTDTVSIARYTSSWIDGISGDPMFKLMSTNTDNAQLVSSLSDKSNLKAYYSMDTEILGGTYADFNGSSSYSSIGGSASDWKFLSDGSAWTVSFWFNDDSSSQNSRFFNTMNDNSGSNRGFSLTHDATAIGLGIYDSTPSAGYPFAYAVSNAFSDTGAWHMYTFAYDGGNTANTSKVRFYKDGSLTNTTTQGRAMSSSDPNHSPLMGKRTDNQRYVDGKLQQFLIYKRELSASDVTALYNSGTVPTSPSTTNLYAWWKFADNMNDSGSGGNNGDTNNITFSTNPSTCPNDVSTTSELDGMTNLPANTIFEQTTDTPSYWWKQSDNTWLAEYDYAYGILVAALGGFSTADSSGFVAGGTTTGAGAVSDHGQSWNGTTWANMTSFSYSANYGQGGGNATDAIVMGGSSTTGGNGGSSPRNDSTKWNGSSWSATNDLSVNRNMGGGGGNSSSAMCFGGTYSQLASTDTFNGTSWSAGGNLAEGIRGFNGDAANNDSAFSVGGYNGSGNTTTTQKYASGVWSSVTSIGSSSLQGDHGGCGTQISFLSATVSTSSGTIDFWNGTAWATTGNTVGGRRGIYGGNGGKAFKTSGDDVGNTTSEYYNGTSWASQGTLETHVRSPIGAGGNT